MKDVYQGAQYVDGVSVNKLTQEEALIPPTLASLMAHQVHFHKTGAILLPVGETLDRNLVFEQRSRLGPRAPRRSDVLT